MKLSRLTARGGEETLTTVSEAPRITCTLQDSHSVRQANASLKANEMSNIKQNFYTPKLTPDDGTFVSAECVKICFTL